MNTMSEIIYTKEQMESINAMAAMMKEKLHQMHQDEKNRKKQAILKAQATLSETYAFQLGQPG